MPRRMEPRDLFSLRSVADPNISPDGNLLAYVVTRAVEDENRNVASIQIRSLHQGSFERELTVNGAELTSPRWSPSGDRLAYLSTEGEQTQVFLCSLSNGEIMQVTSSPTPVTEYTWDPAGQHVFYVADDSSDRTDYGASDTVVLRSLAYKFNGEGFVEGKRKQLFRASLPSFDTEQLTSRDFDVSQLAVDDGGRTVAFTATRIADRESHLESDVWIFDLTTHSLQRVTPGDGTYSKPAWSRNGTRLAYIGHRTADGGAYPTQDALYVWDRHASTHATLLTSLDRSPGYASTTDTVFHVPVSVPQWSPDGSRILTLVADAGSVSLYAASIDGSQDEMLLTAGEIQSFTVTPDGSCYYTKSFMASPAEVFVTSDGSTETQLTFENRALTDEIQFGDCRDLWAESDQCVGVHSRVVLPPGYTEDGSYPVILAIHGGPHSMFSAGFSYWVHVLSATGYIVLMPNPRASTGYGQEWAAAIQNDWGGADYRDVIASLDALVEQYPVETSRIGITGESYGGYMTNWAITQTSRFAAAVTQNSSCNRYSLYGTADMVMMYSDREFGGSPYEVPENYLQRSPITFVANVTTPTLILHSENDMRVPISQGEEWFVALRKHGAEVEFVRFPGEHHLITKLGTPLHRIERIERTRRWFDEHM